MTDLPFTLPAPDSTRPERKPARCRRHVWALKFDYVGHEVRGGVAITTTGAIVHVAPGTKLMMEPVATNEYACIRCGHVRQPVASKRGRNNRKRGVSDELAVARLLGGEKIGPLGLPWDVVVPGYLRAQCKKTGRWPSLASVVAWLDAIPAGPELRAVTLADTPGPGGGKTRRLIVLDLSEFAAFHGRGGTDVSE